MRMEEELSYQAEPSGSATTRAALARPSYQAEPRALTIAMALAHAMTEPPRQESMASTLAPSTDEEPMAAPIFSSFFAHLAASSSSFLTIFIPSSISLPTPEANSSLSPTVPSSFLHTSNASANILSAFAPTSSDFETTFHYATTVLHAPPYMFHTEGAVLTITIVLFLLLYDIQLPVCRCLPNFDHLPSYLHKCIRLRIIFPRFETNVLVASRGSNKCSNLFAKYSSIVSLYTFPNRPRNTAELFGRE